MKKHSLDKLYQIINSKSSDESIKSKAMEELKRRDMLRTNIFVALPSWIAAFAAVITLAITLLNNA